MAQFDLNFAVAGNLEPSWLPTVPLRIPKTNGSFTSIEAIYSSASSGMIELRPDFAGMSTPVLASLPAVGSADLQSVLTAITDNRSSVWPVPTLGVIYAPLYRPRPTVYGLMFDKGIEDPFDPTSDPALHRWAREGCAIFLGAIAHTGLARPDYDNQVAFTTVHELGHVFNLQHIESAPCFLNTSTLEAPRLNAFKFLRELHEDRLLRVEFDRTVAPGGSVFSETGVFANLDAPTARGRMDPMRLRIEADMHPSEFWPWEPVELDVRLVPGAGLKKQTLRVPDEVDAGYYRFEIWIEEPTGERRRYRSPRRYCALPGSIELRDGDVWQRDISIFCEAGGYTFRKSGLHRIWVRFQVSPGLCVESEPYEIHIKEWSARNARTRSRLLESESLLRRSRHTLYYRSGSSRSDEIAALERLAANYRREHSGGSAMYALGRLCASRAMRTRRKEALKCAEKFLKRAAQHQAISGHRRSNAEKVLAELHATAGTAAPRTPRRSR